MSYSDYLTETCTIYTVTQAPDINGMTVDTKVILYETIPCVRENLTYSYRYTTDKDGVNYTDVFMCKKLNVNSITSKHIVVQDGVEYRVVKAVDPMNRGHHTEIYTELIK